MPADPRLRDIQLLTLAAYRLQQRRLTPQPPHWEATEGLAALLAVARRLPQRAPFDLPAVEECTGMAKLLAAARASEKEHQHGA
jgi:hypothetical protein